MYFDYYSTQAIHYWVSAIILLFLTSHFILGTYKSAIGGVASGCELQREVFQRTYFIITRENPLHKFSVQIGYAIELYLDFISLILTSRRIKGERGLLISSSVSLGVTASQALIGSTWVSYLTTFVFVNSVS